MKASWENSVKLNELPSWNKVLLLLLLLLGINANVHFTIYLPKFNIFYAIKLSFLNCAWANVIKYYKVVNNPPLTHLLYKIWQQWAIYIIVKFHVQNKFLTQYQITQLFKVLYSCLNYFPCSIVCLSMDWF